MQCQIFAGKYHGWQTFFFFDGHGWQTLNVCKPRQQLLNTIMPMRVFISKKEKKNHYAFPAVAAGREYRGASPARGRPEPSPPSVARSDGRLQVLGPSIPGVLGPPSPLVYKTSRRPLHFERRSERETEQPQSHRPCRSGRRSPSISSPLPLGKAPSFTRSSLGPSSRFPALICAVSA